jgi:hypothetical protein
MIAAAYDWSGFYTGLNGGGASSRECWTITNDNGNAVTPNSEGCHDATGGWPVARSVIAGRPPIGCSALKPRAIGPT